MDGQTRLHSHADILRATDSEQLCCEVPGTANGFAVSCTISRRSDRGRNLPYPIWLLLPCRKRLSRF